MDQDMDDIIPTRTDQAQARCRARIQLPHCQQWLPDTVVGE